MDWLKLVQKLVAWVTFKKVGLLALATAVGIVLLTVFEQRAAFWSPSDNSAPRPVEHVRLKIKERMAVRMKTYVDSNPLVTLILVRSANIRLNEIDAVFSYSDDPVITYDLNDYYTKNSTVRQLFGADDNSNAATVRTINGEFDCYRNISFIKGIDNARVPQICSMSIPPHYGQFVGYIAVGLARHPTADEKTEVKRVLSDISSNIFFDNISSR